MIQFLRVFLVSACWRPTFIKVAGGLACYPRLESGFEHLDSKHTNIHIPRSGVVFSRPTDEWTVVRKSANMFSINARSTKQAPLRA